MWPDVREVAGKLRELRSSCWWRCVIDEKLTRERLNNGLFSTSADLCLFLLTERKISYFFVESGVVFFAFSKCKTRKNDMKKF